MRKVILFIASSLDSYIARPSSDIDWLFTDQDYGYSEFFATVDTVLMGRKTYKQVLTFGEYPYKEKKTYVFTNNSSLKRYNNADIATDVRKFVDNLRQVDGKNIWLIGGSLLIRDFMSKNLVDELILSIHPIILGEGIPLFAHQINATSLKLNGCQKIQFGACPAILQCYELSAIALLYYKITILIYNATPSYPFVDKREGNNDNQL